MGLTVKANDNDLYTQRKAHNNEDGEALPRELLRG